MPELGEIESCVKRGWREALVCLAQNSIVKWLPVKSIVGPVVLLLIPFDIRDVDDPDCSQTLDLGLLESCSTTCALTIDDHTMVCSDEGTPIDASDDSISLELLPIDGMYLVGKRVEHRFKSADDGEEYWYSGSVVGFDRTTEKHTIQYDFAADEEDGDDEEEEDLSDAIYDEPLLSDYVNGDVRIC